MINLVDSVVFKRLVNSKSSNRHYKSFKTWPHFVTMMFGILSRYDSMTETCEGLRAVSGKLNHLGLSVSADLQSRMYENIAHLSN